MRGVRFLAGAGPVGVEGEGDYRDWQAIDDWPAAIAQQLQQGRIGAGGPDARA